MKKWRDQILWWAFKKNLSRSQTTIIAVGGAVGKTSTKIALGTLLETAYPGQVRTGFGNLNSYLGVPLAALGYKIDFYQTKIGFVQWLKVLISVVWRGLTAHFPRYLVLEFGTDRPDDIKNITAQLQPDIGVLTIVGPAHLGNYPSIQAIADDEGYLIERTKSSGVVFLNAADEFLADHQRRAHARTVVVTTSLEKMAPSYMEALGRELNIDETIMAKALDSYQAPDHRLNVVQLGRFTLLDDSYNASPLSMKAGLNTLAKQSGRKVAILGSMLELGESSPQLHQEIGQYARQQADLIIGVGDLAQEYKADHWYRQSTDLGEEVFQILQDGDSILIKGSKAIHMEKIIELITNHERA